jgi:hypothetical protein
MTLVGRTPWSARVPRTRCSRREIGIVAASVLVGKITPIRSWLRSASGLTIVHRAILKEADEGVGRDQGVRPRGPPYAARFAMSAVWKGYRVEAV